MENKKVKNEILNVFGCTLSKDKKYLKLTLIKGRKEDNSIKYYYSLIKTDNSQKVKVKKDKDNKSYLIKVPFKEFKESGIDTSDLDEFDN